MTLNHCCASLMMCLVIAFCLITHGRAQNPKEEQQNLEIGRIAKDWKRRLEQSKPIKYRITGTIVVTKEYQDQIENKGSKTWESKDVTLKRSSTLILDLEGKRQRLEDSNESLNISTGSIIRREGSAAFDAKTRYSHGKTFIDEVEQKRPDRSDVALMTKDFQRVAFDDDFAPLFAGHGIVVIPPRKDITLENMNQETKIDDLVYIHGNGVWEGRSCVILRTPARKGDAFSFSEYWVDPSRDSALVRDIVGNEKYPVFERNINYVKTEAGWLVNSWTKYSRGLRKDGSVFMERFSQYKVDERLITYAANTEDFTIQVEPGMLVRKGLDQKKELQKLYRVDSTGREHQVRFENGTERQVWGFQDYLIYLLVAIAVLALCLFGIWRTRLRQRTKQTSVK